MMWEYEGLHVIDVLTRDDLELWLGNCRDPETRNLIEYWIRLMNEKTGEPLTIWDDTIFLYAIGFEWFLDSLLKRKENLCNPKPAPTM